MSALEVYALQNKQESLAKNMFTGSLDDGIVLVKAVGTILERLGYPPVILDEMELLDPELFEKAKLEIVKQLSKAALQTRSAIDEAEIRAVYSPAEIARFMGLSHTTISNYIASGRFEGIERPEPGKHVEISGKTVFTYPNGDSVQVNQIARKFKERMNRAQMEEKESEISFIENKIKAYNERYGSMESLNKEIKTGESLKDTSAALDLDVWQYLESRKAELLV